MSRIRFSVLAGCGLLAWSVLCAQAQTGTPRAADFIVAVVNSEPITNHEVSLEARRLARQLAQQRRPAPPAAELARLVLERMIDERAQLQLARESGIRIEDASIDQAEQAVAEQNQISLAELRRRVALDGLAPGRFRDQLRDQLMLTRLRERDVDPKVRVSDLEVERHIQEQTAAAAQDPSRQQLNLAQILVALPEQASAQQVAALRERADTARRRAQAGENFAALARELSDGPERANGGQFGLRPADRLPPLFLTAVAELAPGQTSAVLRSDAGFHILQVVERQISGLPPTSVSQSRSRHILLRTGAQISEAQARERLLDFKRRIESGLTGFAALAREYSQDGSAAQGGDLGWANPGQFVPEFEAALNRLAPGQISEPLISRFGVHLIELLERRTASLSAAEQREMVRALLRERKLDETYATWVRDVRARAYVELREPPQ